MYQNFETDSTHTFNMSLATLERIHNILKELERYRMMAHAPLTIRSLNSLIKEVHPFLKEDEKQYCVDCYRDLNLKLNMGILGDGKKYNFTLIDNLELWLRDQLYKKKLLMAVSDNPSFSLR